MSKPAPNTIANREDATAKLKAAMAHGTVTLRVTPDISKFITPTNEAMRGLAAACRGIAREGRQFSREIHQLQRNLRTGPLSDERREIQEIGRREMAEAVEWFRARRGVTG